MPKSSAFARRRATDPCQPDLTTSRPLCSIYPAQMDWSDVRDPTDKFLIQANWTLVRREYVPEAIQALIDEGGVQAMVRMVNNHFKQCFGHNALILTRVNQLTAVEDAEFES